MKGSELPRIRDRGWEKKKKGSVIFFIARDDLPSENLGNLYNFSEELDHKYIKYQKFW